MYFFFRCGMTHLGYSSKKLEKIFKIARGDVSETCSLNRVKLM